MYVQIAFCIAQMAHRSAIYRSSVFHLDDKNEADNTYDAYDALIYSTNGASLRSAKTLVKYVYKTE